MIRLNVKRAKQDPEKCVLPTIVYINTNHSSFGDLRKNGFMLFIGWWDFSISFGVIFTNQKSLSTNTQAFSDK